MHPYKILIKVLVICNYYHQVVTKVVLPPSLLLASTDELFYPSNLVFRIGGLGVLSFSKNPMYQKKVFWLRATEPKIKHIENNVYKFRIKSSDEFSPTRFLIDENQTRSGILDCEETQYSKLKMFISDYQNVMAFYQCIDVRWAENGTDYEILVQLLVLFSNAASENNYAALRKITFYLKELQYLFDTSSDISQFCDFDYFFNKNCNEQEDPKATPQSPEKVNPILIAATVLLISLGAFCAMKYLVRTYRQPNRVTPELQG